MIRRPPRSTPLSLHDALPISPPRAALGAGPGLARGHGPRPGASAVPPRDRKSTRLNSSHSQISYAVFCLKKKIKSKNVYSRVNSKSKTQWNKTDIANCVHLDA